MRYVYKKKAISCGVIVTALIIILHPNMNARRSYEYMSKNIILANLHEEVSANFTSSAATDCDYWETIEDDTTISISLVDGDLIEGHRIKEGGEYAPQDCRPKFSTAIIVPYRDKPEQLRGFLVYMHIILRRQKIHYRIFVIEQEDQQPFNRAMLFNVGAVAAMKAGYPCLVLHDIDLLPLRPSNIYACTEQPRHMSASINQFSMQTLGLARPVDFPCFIPCKYEESDIKRGKTILSTIHASPAVMPQLHYTNLDRLNQYTLLAWCYFHPIPFLLPSLNFVYGVIAIVSKQYKDVNGMSNKNFGWNGEYDDFYSRLEAYNMKVCRFEPATSQYHMFMHKPDDKEERRQRLFRPENSKTSIVGLRNLKYTEVATVLHPLFTHIVVEL